MWDTTVVMSKYKPQSELVPKLCTYKSEQEHTMAVDLTNTHGN